MDENAVARLFEQLGVDTVLFDLDGTLTDTGPIFVEAISTAIGLVAQHNPDKNSEAIRHEILEAITTAHGTVFVNPQKLWPEVLTILKNDYDYVLPEDICQQLLERFSEIYVQIPELRAGIVELLQTLSLIGLKLGVVTHAQEEWTYLKLAAAKSGLPHTDGISFFFDHIYCASVDRKKSPYDWQRALELMNSPAEHSLVIGDNPKADISTSREAGIPYQILIAGGRYCSGEEQISVPEDTVVIWDTNQIIGSLEQLATLPSETHREQDYR